jgi:PHD/YefM family antitoxin component YafN of YafNO toxin-antitoxin module
MSVPRPQFVVDTEGKKTAVLLSVHQYEKLLEDLHDLAVIAARRDEAPMTFEDIKRRLQEDGLV